MCCTRSPSRKSARCVPARFTLVDSIGKKIRVVDEVIRATGLNNVRTVHGRAEQVGGRFDFVVSRAVTEMKTFISWVWDKIDRGEAAGTLPNGILYLKGGDLKDELQAAKCWPPAARKAARD